MLFVSIVEVNTVAEKLQKTYVLRKIYDRLNQRHFTEELSLTITHLGVPFGVTYEKIGTIQRRLAWPLHKDDTLLQSGRSSDRNIYFLFRWFSIPYSPITLNIQIVDFTSFLYGIL